MGFSPEQIALHESIARAKGPEWQARINAIAERDRKARALVNEIHEKLPPGLTGVVMVNADTGEWLNAKDKADGWKKSSRKWGKDIAHPPLWMITLTHEPEYLPPPEIFRP